MMAYIFLIDFNPIVPEFGTLFWTLVAFTLVWVGIGSRAFRPIQNALKKREDDIQYSIDEAKRVRTEMETLKADNQRLLIEAREESMRIKRDAEAAASKILAEAKEDAKAAQQKIASDAKRDIDNMRKAAMIDLKQEVGIIAVDIAEKILRKELANDANQQAFVKDLVSKLN